MREQTFVYRGRQLVAPLVALIAFLTREYTKLKHEIDVFDPSPIKGRPLMIGEETPAQKLGRMKAQLKTIEFNIRTATNWLREARRCPWTKWVLDFRDLDWLYPREIDAGTLDSSRTDTFSSSDHPAPQAPKT